MAEITKITCIKNSGSPDVTATAGAASQTVAYDRSFENIVIRVENTNLNTASITLVTAGSMTSKADNVVVEVAQNEVKYLAGLESMYFKGSDGNMTIEILDDDGTAFTGDPADVNFEVIELPKGLIN